MYDLIGDIHGRAEELVLLLQRLGYTQRDGVFRHPERRVIFVGDLIDSGPHQRQVINIARRMVEQGSALAVMGNHEFNALAFHQEHPHEPETWLRPHTEKNISQHQAFLQAYQGREEELVSVLDWFRTLPLWLDLEEGVRVVHACWHTHSMAVLQPLLGANNTLTEDLLVRASQDGSEEFVAVETLLKGLEKALPEGISFNDHNGTERKQVRVKWWFDKPKTYGEVALPAHVAENNPVLHSTALTPGISFGYADTNPPVFFGHYWFVGEPGPVHTNAACLDYSVGSGTGKLVAYRWSGELQLETGNFAWVYRQDGPEAQPH
jgi:hypothetical protein